MSHFHERKEKICLNCGAELYDRYCHKCGQENVEPKQNFWQLTTHFIEDVTHFDGKFFTTVKYLLFKPGYLTEEYIKGRRASHINPIRMYLFISAMFFLIQASFLSPHNESTIKSTEVPGRTDTAINKAISSITKIGEAINDTSEANKNIIDGEDTIIINNGTRINYGNDSWLPEETVAEYDSIQKALPKFKRDGWIKHYYKRKLIAARESSHENWELMKLRIEANFYHTLPFMLFCSLPLIALLLKLLYLSRRKEYYYVSHIIFLIHYYCVAFLIILFTRLIRLPGSFILNIISILVFFAGIFYLYKAMRKFYKQGRFKTFIKFSLLSFFGYFLLLILTVIVAINSFLNAA